MLDFRFNTPIPSLNQGQGNVFMLRECAESISRIKLLLGMYFLQKFSKKIFSENGLRLLPSFKKSLGTIYTPATTRQCIFVLRDASRVGVYSLLRDSAFCVFLCRELAFIVCRATRRVVRRITSTWFEKTFIHQQALVVQ